MTTPILHDITLQTTITALLNDRGPEYRHNLEEIVAWEVANPTDGTEWWGWEWQEVHTPVSVINTMIAKGVIDMASRSRSRTIYRLRSLPDTQEALASLDIMADFVEENKGADIDDLFGSVIGHDDVKAVLRLALKVPEPVHILLEGPPATAKTLLSTDIRRLQGAHFYVGSTTTKSGLVQFLLEQRPKILIIDEIDKMAQSDSNPLLNLMETGEVTRLQHNHRDCIQMKVKVFGTANEPDRIQSPLLSRFRRLKIEPYTAQQFVAVAQQVLMERERLGPDMARLVAYAVVKHSLDIRDAIGVARLAYKNPNAVEVAVRAFWPERRR